MLCSRTNIISHRLKSLIDVKKLGQCNKNTAILLTRQYHIKAPTSLISTFHGSNYTNIIKPSPNLLDTISFSTTAPEGTKAPLDAELLQKIKQDLITSDLNHDGRIDASELKLILKKYSDTFSDEDIVKITDMFYVSRGGESVSHERFINAISVAMGVDIYDKSKDTGMYPLELGRCGAEYMYGKVRGAYTPEEIDIKITHVEPQNTRDKLALFAVQIIRFLFDAVSLWNHGEITQAKIFRRVIFLETVAAIPGFVAAMVRHFKSLRRFERDGGMLNMFLDEANNERMHLLTFVRMRDPPKVMRYVVLVSQSFIGVGFFILYNLSPDFCHRFVGYVEEEACHTYTDIIQAVENAPEGSELAEWRTEVAPAIARGYWHLGAKASVLDLFYAVRADEAEHRDVNHICSGLKEDEVSSFC